VIDLNDLGKWTDGDVVFALSEIDHGLNEREVEWVERLGRAYTNAGSLSPRQRETAEDILRRANMRGLCD